MVKIYYQYYNNGIAIYTISNNVGLGMGLQETNNSDKFQQGESSYSLHHIHLRSYGDLPRTKNVKVRMILHSGSYGQDNHCCKINKLNQTYNKML